MKIQESAENYLETILVLSLDKPYVRSIDIANELGFSKPSVSVAMKNLRNSGHIRVDENGHITLAPPGKKIAEMIYERHCVIAKILMALGVDEDTAFPGRQQRDCLRGCLPDRACHQRGELCRH